MTEDNAAAEYYNKPENRQPAGPPRRRAAGSRRLDSHVPIRFSVATISRVKEVAAEDGKTVSSWIREVVEREILRRQRPITFGAVTVVSWQPKPSTSTIGTGSESGDGWDQSAG